MVRTIALPRSRVRVGSGRRPLPLQAIVVPLIVLSMLPLPLITIRSAGFGFGTMAAPLILFLGLALAHRRRLAVDIPYVGLYALLLTVGVISVVNSWLFWDPNVGTSMELGFGHRWIGYQVTALFFLATPFLAFAAGIVYAQLERLTSLYVGVLTSVTVTTCIGLWSWWHNPVNPIDVYLKGARPNINPDATLFLIALSAALLVWQRHRWQLWVPALLLLTVGLVAAFLSYALNAWLGGLGAITVLIWSRWRGRGLLAWFAGLGLVALAVQETIGTIVSQRLGGNDVDRIGLWHSALIIWSKSPIVGVGAGNLVSYMERFSVFSIALVLQGYQQAHNIFLEVLAELGLLGLALFLTFIGVVIWRLTRRTAGQSLAARHFQAAGLAMLVGSALMAVVGSGLVPTIASAGWEGIPPVVVCWFFAGAGVAMASKSPSPLRGGPVGPRERRFSARRAFETFGLGRGSQ
jgi:O-antigen ligase